jgi:hypothetical protein
MKTTMQELLEYVKNCNALVILPDTLAEMIENKFLDKEKRMIIDSFNEGEFNVWNHERDECFEFESGQDFFNKTFNK